jgi:glucans biosynthesis protein
VQQSDVIRRLLPTLVRVPFQRMSMNRRSFVMRGTALAALAMTTPVSAILAQEAAPQQAAPQAVPPAFDHAAVVQEAKRLAADAYEPPPTFPPALADITYDQYRGIRFRPEARVWGKDGTPFTLDLFHPGFIYRVPVRIAIVENGVARELAFSPDLYSYDLGAKPESVEDLGFSGFRVRTTINTPDYPDEFLVFQGASYFRAIARSQLYGLSARAVSIDTAEPKGEEFPSFTHFWIEKPGPHAASLVIHALLDSPSMTGAYRFTVQPGAETVMDVDATIFARQEIGKLGIAPLTSMFFYDASNRSRFDDFRAAVHDSDGLQILTSGGEWVWRPLANPKDLQISAFADKRPRGFGLMQRKRSFAEFEDLEAQYQRRPSLWIEPQGDWADGAVELVEIPTPNEFNDNIVAYWRPTAPVPAGGPYHYAYRMRWTDTVRPDHNLLTVQETRIGLNSLQDRRVFMVDFAAPAGFDPTTLTIEATSSAGSPANPVVHGIVPDGAIRVSFDLDTSNLKLAELRLRLLVDGKPVSETWLYRWTAS